jgi:hypothetical protein
MKKRLVLTTVFVAIFGCFVSMADVHDRDYKGNSKGHKTEKVEKKNDNKKDKVSNKHKPSKPVAHKPAPKPNHKPVAHKPNHKPNKHVAHKPHKPAPRPVCHVKHHHKPECHKPVAYCNKQVVHRYDPVAVNGVVAGAVTTAAVIGLIAAIAD